MRIFLSFVLLFSISFNSQAQVTKRQFGAGAGATCKEWVNINDDFYKQWILGYLSGIAMGLNKNILDGTSPHTITQQVKDECEIRPEELIFKAALQIAKRLNDGEN